MFEKEAEEYWYDSGSNEFDIGQVEKACKQSFKDGAEFGYNKAIVEIKDAYEDNGNFLAWFENYLEGKNV